MNRGIVALLFFGMFLLQPTILNGLSLWGASANGFLCLTVFLLLLGASPLAVLGFGAFFGLLYDLCVAAKTGPMALGLLAVGAVLIFLRPMFHRESLLSILLVVAGGTLVYNLILWGIYALLGSPWNLGYVLLLQPLYISYNALAATLCYGLLRKAGVSFA